MKQRSLANQHLMLEAFKRRFDAVEVPVGRTGVTSTASWDHTRNTSEVRNTILTDAERARHEKARAAFDAAQAEAAQPELFEDAA